MEKAATFLIIFVMWDISHQKDKATGNLMKDTILHIRNNSHSTNRRVDKNVGLILTVDFEDFDYKENISRNISPIQANNIKPRRLIAHQCVWLPWPPLRTCHCWESSETSDVKPHQQHPGPRVESRSRRDVFFRLQYKLMVPKTKQTSKPDRGCLTKQQTTEKRGSTSNKYDLSSPTPPSCVNHSANIPLFSLLSSLLHSCKRQSKWVTYTHISHYTVFCSVGLSRAFGSGYVRPPLWVSEDANIFV